MCAAAKNGEGMYGGGKRPVDQYDRLASEELAGRYMHVHRNTGTNWPNFWSDNEASPQPTMRINSDAQFVPISCKGA